MALATPCAIFAPLIFVLFILALPLWPVALVLVGLAWCVVWPLERLLSALGAGAMRGWSAWIGYAFVVILKPWYFFDPVNVRAARRARFGIKGQDTITPS